MFSYFIIRWELSTYTRSERADLKSFFQERGSSIVFILRNEIDRYLANNRRLKKGGPRHSVSLCDASYGLRNKWGWLKHENRGEDLEIWAKTTKIRKKPTVWEMDSDAFHHPWNHGPSSARWGKRRAVFVAAIVPMMSWRTCSRGPGKQEQETLICGIKRHEETKSWSSAWGAQVRTVLVRSEGWSKPAVRKYLTEQEGSLPYLFCLVAWGTSY